MHLPHPQVDEFLLNAKRWPKELIQLRRIILDCGLTEEFKWQNPCYTYQGSNIIIIGEFKDYCAFSFFKGVLLADVEKLLVKPGENSQSTRLFKFKHVTEILQLEPIIRTYIFEALEIEKTGLKVELKSNSELVFPDELIQKMSGDPEFKKAFESLTPGRQRAYTMFFTSTQSSSTRKNRIEKYVGRILISKGINDCICGLSKRMPSCDGSHKFLKSGH
jgi:uncharacterized protein YdeI (YjbR/CyaY-like superfamily)